MIVLNLLAWFIESLLSFKGDNYIQICTSIIKEVDGEMTEFFISEYLMLLFFFLQLFIFFVNTISKPFIFFELQIIYSWKYRNLKEEKVSMKKWEVWSTIIKAQPTPT